jgi:hypothetical protein
VGRASEDMYATLSISGFREVIQVQGSRSEELRKGQGRVGRVKRGEVRCCGREASRYGGICPEVQSVGGRAWHGRRA